MWWNEKYKRWVNHTPKKKKKCLLTKSNLNGMLRLNEQLGRAIGMKALKKSLSINNNINKDPNASWEKGKSWEKIPVEWRKISAGAWVDNSTAMGRGLRGSAVAYWAEQRAWVRMMDERSWTSKMGEEDDESDRRWCVGSTVRMMDERSWASKMGKKNDESGRRWWNGRGIKEVERMSVTRQRIKSNRKRKK